MKFGESRSISNCLNRTIQKIHLFCGIIISDKWNEMACGKWDNNESVLISHAGPNFINPFSANRRKWLNTLKQFVGYWRQIV